MNSLLASMACTSVVGVTRLQAVRTSWRRRNVSFDNRLGTISAINKILHKSTLAAKYELLATCGGLFCEAATETDYVHLVPQGLDVNGQARDRNSKIE